MTVASLPLSLLAEYRRNVFLIVLLLVVPFAFITVSYYITASIPLTFRIAEHGSLRSIVRPMPDVHAAVMVPITAAALAGLMGLFSMVEAAQTDARLVVAGLPAARVARSRLAIIVSLSVVVSAVSVAVTLVNFRPADPGGFMAGNILAGVSYGFLGACIALIVGRLGGAYLMFFLPLIDIGIFQDPMFISGEQSVWMKVLPGFGGTRLVIDAAFGSAGGDWVALLAAVGWAALLGAVALVLFTLQTRR